MEQLNLHHLSLFIEEAIYLIPGDDLHIPSPDIATNQKQSFIDKSLDTNEDQEHAISIEEASKVVIEINYKGNFEKGVLVIYEDAVLSLELQELLFKILGAVGCSLKDIALVSKPDLEVSDMESILALNPSKIILFGTFAHDLMHYRQELYKIHAEDGMEFLFANGLEAIHSNVSLKKSLWNQLQILFGIKK
jgi:hypothetical protein